MYNVCVIGAGDRGTAHATTWAARDDARVVSVCDIDEERCSRLAEAHDAACYTDFSDALGHEGIDIVSVCVPTYLHAPVIVEAAGRGYHIMGEKPLALTLDQAREIEQALDSSGVHYSACFQHRDRGLFRRLREFQREGRFGSPVHFRFIDIRDVRPKTAMHTASENGGVVIDMACHMFDMVRYLTGEEIIRVWAHGNIFGKGKPTLASVSDFAVDAAQIEFDTDGGNHGSLYLNWGMPEGFSAWGNGTMLIGPDASAHSGAGEIIFTAGDHQERWPDSSVGSNVRIDRLVAAIEGRTPLDVTYRDARITLDLSHAALESIETHRVVEYTPYGS